MKTAMRHILCMFFLFSLTFSLYGRQETEPKPDNDGRLTRYELLCKECLELKDLVAEGKQISRAYASDMIAGFVAMNRDQGGVRFPHPAAGQQIRNDKQMVLDREKAHGAGPCPYDR